MKLEMLVNCAACYNRMKVANHEISNRPETRRAVGEAIDCDYDGSVKSATSSRCSSRISACRRSPGR